MCTDVVNTTATSGKANDICRHAAPFVVRRPAVAQPFGRAWLALNLRSAADMLATKSYCGCGSNLAFGAPPS